MVVYLQHVNRETQKNQAMAYNPREIRKMYESLSDTGKVSVLMDALMSMQSCNSRSRLECIALAMGYLKYGNGLYYKKTEI
jgi:hypothetical protein